jgi:glucose-1-phosphate thymidylyltransferase
VLFCFHPVAADEARRPDVPFPPRDCELLDLPLTTIEHARVQLICLLETYLRWQRDCNLAHRMWGIIPAAGKGSRIQPLAFSKELLPVGSRIDTAGRERPRAVSEYLIERMLLAGVDKFCFIISPGKSDILEYYGGRIDCADVCYVVQSQPAGLCDAIFRALPLIAPDDSLFVGLPDTVWFPVDGLRRLSAGTLSFLLFPVCHPELFDAVLADDAGNVRAIQVKQPGASTGWIWGAFGLTGTIYQQLHSLWLQREPRDEYLGTLVNEYLNRGGRATAVRAGEVYVDVGTIDGYREALQAIDRESQLQYDRFHESGRDSQASSGTRLLVP